ncbi:hypothetical protein EUTSA_v10027047mg [Eutrema salsugineum]|uniref:Disease resistance protein At4g27190-like leucine-rich repeats domain-containing protein n=1 Tax=Eutrema salsugineum TaxID=72664 RepID=V4MHS1_EUTSA|nr:hypothetical protein EUTSA_v10027047mg [Eutrema salsugineum]
MVNISGEFFRFMPNLVVLDIHTGLAKQISELVSFRYLDLLYPNIERLPVGLKELKRLIHLNLKRLESISTISNLSSLWTLRQQKQKTPFYSNLSKVVIGQCDGLKDLTWLLFAPNLTYLDVPFAEQLEDSISEEKAARFTDENASIIIIPFQKLECLSLSHLPKLKSIYWRPLSFPRLSKLAVHERCTNLKRLLLDTKGAAAGVELVLKYGENK